MVLKQGKPKPVKLKIYSTTSNFNIEVVIIAELQYSGTHDCNQWIILCMYHVARIYLREKLSIIER